MKIYNGNKKITSHWYYYYIIHNTLSVGEQNRLTDKNIYFLVYAENYFLASPETDFFVIFYGELVRQPAILYNVSFRPPPWVLAII